MKRRRDVATLAQQLAATYLAGGNFVLSGALKADAITELMPAAAHAEAAGGYLDEVGFSGLAVQAVGYEEGADEPKIHVYVTKGRHQERDIGPDGVPVVVDRVGRVMVRPETAAAATHRGNVFERNGRVACGSSCAPSGETYAGTLGALARKRSGRDLYLLSNNHVLAAGNHVPVGMPILCPSPIDAGPATRAPGEVGRHAEICELRSGVPTLVAPGREDVALARVTDPAVVSSWQGAGPDSYDTPTTVVPPRFGVEVKKFGRTTGLTHGTVEALINSPFALPYKCRFFSATVWFHDVWTVRASPGTPSFALPGDSGSLVVTRDGAGAVGVVFATSMPHGEVSFIIPMPHISGLFGGITLVGRHGTQ